MPAAPPPTDAPADDVAPADAGERLRRWGPRLLWLGATLVAINLLAAVVGASMAEPLRFSRPLAQVKDDQLRELVAQGGCIDVVAVGDSLPGFGIDPEVLEAQLPGLRAYNAALAGSQASMNEDWVRRFVVPVADPSTVLVGVSSLSFAPGTQLAGAEVRDWEQALETRTGALADADRTAADLLPLVRYRSRLTDPEEWGRLLRGDEALDLFRGAYEQTPDDIRRGLGQVESNRRFDPGTPEGDAIAVGTRTVLMPGWQLDDDQLAAFRRQIRELADDDRTPVVVLFPVTDLYIDAHPDGRADYERALSTVRTIAAEEGVPLADLSALPLPPQAFVDTHHLNVDGARQVTSALVDELDRLGVTVTPCRPTG